MRIDDRFLMVAITISILACYVFTKDPMLGELMKYTLGATFGMFTSPNKNWIMTSTSDLQAKAIVAEFTGRN